MDLSDPGLVEAVAAYYQSKKKKDGGKKQSGKQQGGGGGGKEHSDKECNFCHRMGHIKANCLTWKGIQERKTGKVAAAQPAEN